MRVRGLGVVVVAAVVLLVGMSPGALAASHPAAGATCTWGGTTTAPTGTFTISPGLTSIPLPRAAAFHVTGALAGGAGCTGTLTYDGQIDASGTCSFSTFEGRAKGIRGVTDFAGVGIGPFGPARLYDRAGNVVASENADINTVANLPHYGDCLTPSGFTGGNFSSVIVFVDQQETAA